MSPAQTKPKPGSRPKPGSAPKAAPARRRPAQKRRQRSGFDQRWLGAALVLLLGLGVVSATQHALDALLPDSLPQLPFVPTGSKPCVVEAGSRQVRLERDQAANAATIAAVGLRRGVPVRGVTIAIATAMQESKLHDLSSGDRDSVGLFQQRPSQGWGTPVQIRDPVYAAGKFYAALERVDGWERMPLTRAAQAVQRSGLPGAYAKHERDATVLSAALTGSAQAALSCRTKVASGKVEPEGATGLTPRAVRVRSAVERVWGRQSLGGFAPGGVTTGHMERSAHYEGRAIDIFFRPVTPAQRRDGWAMAHWLVANSGSLQLATVIYDDRIWTAARSKEGWRPYVSDDPSNAIKQHRDHVHVDVVRGG
ncbi:hypothetical protein EV189_2683 [Motilibacter rhizosphaerae]|uniref:ARB-07466-like C-terminal domain-containing protein n=1 Tax=Motilibacter rhizosphaerae TaxID=598652 RepID=A0A4Q7NQ94_9ACTN|nr:hypothetical protein [Motilibacter rhizosphaerae]RZS87258.1 hypothetical protein EV189_2683 [Motilibacter rhizosphaerae]